MPSKDTALRRFAARSSQAASPTHVESQQMVDAEAGESVDDMYDRLVHTLESRHNATVIVTEGLDPAAVYRLLLEALAS